MKRDCTYYKENTKGADQLGGYRATDLHLYCISKNQVFSELMHDKTNDLGFLSSKLRLAHQPSLIQTFTAANAFS